jgi:hypothetical protein
VREVNIANIRILPMLVLECFITPVSAVSYQNDAQENSGIGWYG